MTKLFVLITFVWGISHSVHAQTDRGDEPKYSLRRRFYLSQNEPEPFSNASEAIIQYNVMDAFSSSLIVIDSYGKKILSFDNLTTQTGEIKISGKDLPIGSYRYALIVHGRAVCVKNMTVQN